MNTHDKARPKPAQSRQARQPKLRTSDRCRRCGREIALQLREEAYCVACRYDRFTKEDDEPED
jgi:ribosomal protein L37E